MKNDDEQPGVPKARLFISYSRKDMAFVDRLAANLRAKGLSPMIDRGEIGAFEDWWDRIKSLIVRSDALIVVISPNSMQSRVCLEEIAFATSLNKRLAPVLLDEPGVEIPAPLSQLQFISFTEGDFEKRCNDLAAGLLIDISWVRKHTELTEAVRNWEASGKHRGLLLRNPALKDFEDWRERRPPEAPAITASQNSFVIESRKGTRRRLVFSTLAISSALVAFILVSTNIGLMVGLSQSEAFRSRLLKGIYDALRGTLQLTDRMPFVVAEIKRLERELTTQPVNPDTESKLLSVYEEAANNYYEAQDRFAAVEVRSKQFYLSQSRYSRKIDAATVNDLLGIAVKYADAKGLLSPGDYREMDDFAIRLFELARRLDFDTPDADQTIVRSYARRSMDRSSEPNRSASLELGQRAVDASNRAISRKDQILAPARASTMSASEKIRFENYVESALQAQKGTALCAMGVAQKADGKAEAALKTLAAAKAALEASKGGEFKQLSESWATIADNAINEIRRGQK